MKDSLKQTKPIGSLVDQAMTLDQASTVMALVDVISEKSLNKTVAVTAARGRGKSSALGLSIAGAIAYGYSNILITAPSPENLKTLFEFIFKGLKALNFKEHQDYEIFSTMNHETKQQSVVRINVF